MNKALICAAAATISAFAYSQDWQRAALFNMNMGDLDLQFQKMNESTAAVERGDWSEALSAFLWLAQKQSFEPDVNRADYFLSAAMCAWNLDDTSAAETYLNRAIDKMRYGDNLGGGCESRAVAFRSRRSEGKWPSIFSSNDFFANTGVHEFIMGPVRAKFNGSISCIAFDG